MSGKPPDGFRVLRSPDGTFEFGIVWLFGVRGYQPLYRGYDTRGEASADAHRYAQMLHSKREFKPMHYWIEKEQNP